MSQRIPYSRGPRRHRRPRYRSQRHETPTPFPLEHDIPFKHLYSLPPGIRSSKFHRANVHGRQQNRNRIYQGRNQRKRSYSPESRYQDAQEIPNSSQQLQPLALGTQQDQSLVHGTQYLRPQSNEFYQPQSLLVDTSKKGTHQKQRCSQQPHVISLKSKDDQLLIHRSPQLQPLCQSNEFHQSEAVPSHSGDQQLQPIPHFSQQPLPLTNELHQPQPYLADSENPQAQSIPNCSQQPHPFPLELTQDKLLVEGFQQDRPLSKEFREQQSHSPYSRPQQAQLIKHCSQEVQHFSLGSQQIYRSNDLRSLLKAFNESQQSQSELHPSDIECEGQKLLMQLHALLENPILQQLLQQNPELQHNETCECKLLLIQLDALLEHPIVQQLLLQYPNLQHHETCECRHLLQSLLENQYLELLHHGTQQPQILQPPVEQHPESPQQQFQQQCVCQHQMSHLSEAQKCLQINPPHSDLKSILTKDDARNQRLKIAAEKILTFLLLEVFNTLAVRKQPEQTLEKYLKETKKYSNSKYKNIFNQTQMKIIRADPSGKSFDVTLLFLAIQHGCDFIEDYHSGAWENFPNTFESYLKKIKDKRNDVAHSLQGLSMKDFLEELKTMRGLLVKTIELMEKKLLLLRKNDDDRLKCKRITKELHEKLDNIRDLPLEPIDLWFQERQETLEEEGIADLVGVFKVISYINPAALITRKDIQIPTHKIYTSIEIEDTERSTGLRRPINQTNFLEYVQAEKARRGMGQGVILIEGTAGSGKTTLVKMVISDWLNGKETGQYLVKTLDRYKFIIPFECRDRNLASFKDLISSLMPTARKSFPDGQVMVECLLDLSTLIIIDGLDELNSESEKMFKEILWLKKHSNIIIICTTRPEKVKDCLLVLPDNVSVIHLRILGIPKRSQVDFVRKCHDQLKEMKFSSQDTDELVYFFKSFNSNLAEYWKLPLNLTLLSLLWAVNPNRINSSTSSTELFESIHELAIEKLLVRLNYATNLSIPLLKEKITVVLATIYSKALISICDDELVLSPDALNNLISHCDTLQLPINEILSAFLFQRNSWSNTGIMSVVSFAYKSSQEYYGARHIFSKMFTNEFSLSKTTSQKIFSYLQAENAPMDFTNDLFSFLSNRKTTKVKSVVDVLEETCPNGLSSLDASIFFNTIVFLTGVIRREKANNFDEKLIKELVRVPFLMKGLTAIDDSNVWELSIITANNKPEIVDVHTSGARCDRLVDLLENLATHECFINSLDVAYLFRSPSEDRGVIMEIIEQVLKRCPVTYYSGQMPRSLPKGEFLSILRVSLVDGNDFKTLLQYLLERKEPLMSLALNVGKLSTKDVCPIPIHVSKGCMNIHFPDIGNDQEGKGQEAGASGGGGDWQGVVDILKTLSPIPGKTKGIGVVFFPRWRLPDPSDMLTFLHSLGGVKVNGVLYFPLRCKPSDSQTEKTLQDAAKALQYVKQGITWGYATDDHIGSIYDLGTWEKK